jgi:hypothetical protein
MNKPLKLEFEKFNRRKLINYVQFLLRHYRLVDANWFLKVEDNFGLDVAVRFNEEIWARLGEVSAKDVIKYMGVEEGGLKNVLEALRYFPWTVIASWRIVSAGRLNKRVVITADRCPPQEARVKSGRDLFACKAMELKCLESFVKIFNRDAKVICHYAPPDPKPQDGWCEWEITLD